MKIPNSEIDQALAGMQTDLGKAILIYELNSLAKSGMTISNKYNQMAAEIYRKHPFLYDEAIDMYKTVYSEEEVEKRIKEMADYFLDKDKKMTIHALGVISEMKDGKTKKEYFMRTIEFLINGYNQGDDTDEMDIAIEQGLVKETIELWKQTALKDPNMAACVPFEFITENESEEKYKPFFLKVIKILEENKDYENAWAYAEQLELEDEAAEFRRLADEQWKIWEQTPEYKRREELREVLLLIDGKEDGIEAARLAKEIGVDEKDISWLTEANHNSFMKGRTEFLKEMGREDLLKELYRKAIDREVRIGNYYKAASYAKEAGLFEEEIKYLEIIEDYEAVADILKEAKRYEESFIAYEKHGDFGEAEKTAELAGDHEKASFYKKVSEFIKTGKFVTLMLLTAISPTFYSYLSEVIALEN